MYAAHHIVTVAHFFRHSVVLYISDTIKACPQGARNFILLSGLALNVKIQCQI